MKMKGINNAKHIRNRHIITIQIKMFPIFIIGDIVRIKRNEHREELWTEKELLKEV